MKRVVAIYTGHGLAQPVKEIFADVLPMVELRSIIDDSLIAEVVGSGGVTSAVRRRLLSYYTIAAELGAHVILNTCSSVGDVVELGQQITDVPILRIDRPMAEFAVEQGRRIGVLATLRTTLDPTTRLLRQVSDAAKTEVELVEGLAGDAYKQLINGNPAGHDEELSKAAKDLVKQGVDTIVLAQGSMARMESQLADETGIRVLASPRMAVEAIREHYA